MLKTEPTLVCDKCFDVILISTPVIIIHEGVYDGVENFEPTLKDDFIKSWHLHLECLDSFVEDYWDIR